MGVEHPVDQKAGVIINDQEQLGPHRGIDLGMGDPRADQHVGDPPLIGRAASHVCSPAQNAVFRRVWSPDGVLDPKPGPSSSFLGQLFVSSIVDRGRFTRCKRFGSLHIS